MDHLGRTSLAPVIVATLALSACGGSTPSAGATVAGTASSTASAGSTASGPCPTSNTRDFAKTRFVADVGLAAGTFHHWIYLPYKAGSFDKGAKGRLTALVKAGAVALVDAKLIDNAYKNAEASPALCTALVAPLGRLDARLSSLKGQLLTGNVSGLGGVDGLVKQVESAAAGKGLSITENADLGAAQSASTNS